MKNLNEMYQSSSRILREKVKNFCVPLVDCLGISQFLHEKLNYSGHYTLFAGLNPGLEEYFLSNNICLHWPLFRHPDHFVSGIWQMRAIENDSFENFLCVSSEKFKVNFSLMLINKTSDGIESFGFGLKSADPLQHIKFYNKLPLLRLFIKRYLEEFCPRFSILKDNLVDVTKLVSPDIYKSPLSKPLEMDLDQQFLKKMRIEIPMPLTKRELEVAQYLVKGYYASQIADLLFLSTRTVEHHMERIKDKFCCSSKPELIQKIQELESLGYLAF